VQAYRLAGNLGELHCCSKCDVEENGLKRSYLYSILVFQFEVTAVLTGLSSPDILSTILFFFMSFQRHVTASSVVGKIVVTAGPKYRIRKLFWDLEFTFPRVLNFDTRWRWVANSTFLPLYPRWKLTVDLPVTQGSGLVSKVFLDVVATRKEFLPQQRIEPRLSR
jgi:hypothetical protein